MWSQTAAMDADICDDRTNHPDARRCAHLDRYLFHQDGRISMSAELHESLHILHHLYHIRAAIHSILHQVVYYQDEEGYCIGEENRLVFSLDVV